MLKFKDIVRYICATVIYLYKYIKDLLKMDSVYDCARPFMLLGGIFGMGGNTLCEIDGVRSVRNTRFSVLIATFITLVIMPAFFIKYVPRLFSVEERSLAVSASMIIIYGRYAFIICTAAMTCIRTYVYCKNLTKVLQILNDTDMMLKQENIHVNYWKIILKTILFGLISYNYAELDSAIRVLSFTDPSPVTSGITIVKILIDYARESYFMWLILFMLIIRERFVGLNKLLLQNVRVTRIMQDDSLLRRISLARDIHEQLSEAVELFSDISRLLIIGVLVSGMLDSLWNAILAAMEWIELEPTGELRNMMLVLVFLEYLYSVVVPLMKIVVLTAVCEGHKNNRQVLNARLRYLISREEDPAIVQQLKQYIWYIHDTPAGLVDVGLVDVDFTLLFMVIDFIVQYVFVIYSYVRPSYTVNPN